ncbi:MAG: glycosyltransferase family 4 protein [Saprospiraceae bacterium]
MNASDLQHIVIISPAHPLRGGIASSTERLAQELQHFGYQVKIYSFSLQYPSVFFPGKTQFTTDSAPVDLKIETLVNSVNPFNWWKIGKRLQRERPDLVIVRFWMPFFGPALGTILRIAKQNGHTQTMAIADNVIPHERRLGDRSLTSYFLRSLDSFITMSRAVADDIRQFIKTEKPIKYVAHPIYDNYGELVEREEAVEFLQLDPTPRYLLFFGFIREYKGLDLLLKAMSDPRVRAMNLKLIVAGEYYSNEAEYEELIAALNIENQLELFNRFIPHDEVRYYFGAADLVVQPYKTATQSGISQLAYHFEKPMVVTDVGGLSEIVEHGKVGYVVDVEVMAIANAIVDFFNQNRYEEMWRGVQENKTLFSWENMVRGIEENYENGRRLMADG